MPVLLALPLLLPVGLPLVWDLAKILGVPVALFLLARFVTIRDKKREAAAAALKTRNEKDEASRVAAIDADYGRTHKAIDEMRDTTKHLQADMQALKLEVTHRSEASKETMSRIDNQLSRLIEKFIDRT